MAVLSMDLQQMAWVLCRAFLLNLLVVLEIVVGDCDKLASRPIQADFGHPGKTL